MIATVIHIAFPFVDFGASGSNPSIISHCATSAVQNTPIPETIESAINNELIIES